MLGLGRELGADVISFQGNCEGAFCERIHAADEEGIDAVLINAGARTYYSDGIRDALAILTVPVVEIHMSNIHAREPFRHLAVFAEIVRGHLCGFGVDSYLLGLRAAVAAVQAGARDHPSRKDRHAYKGGVSFQLVVSERAAAAEAR